MDDDRECYFNFILTGGFVMADYRVTANVNGSRVVEEVKGAHSSGSAKSIAESRYSGQRITVIKVERQ